MKIKISERDLLDLISWARRYCDNRSTYAPSSFNQLYDRLVIDCSFIEEYDEKDHTLKDRGKYFPHAYDPLDHENI